MTEEFEATQEELTAANEELQSANEELQSTNEELETAKEELQSTNEELTTVNDELQIRNTDLLTLSSDLDNLLKSVEIPILIVGNDHRIRRFTPTAERGFKLISSDVGRPIGDIRPNFDLNLDALISEVTKSLNPQEKEIKNHQGRWMRLQIKPYKTVDNRIDGAVISLMDIELLKQQISVSKRARDYLTSVAETVKLPLVILDDQLCLLSANHAFWEGFKLSPEISGKKLFTIPEMQGDSVQRIKTLLAETLRSNKEVGGVELDCEFPHIGRRVLLLSAGLIHWMREESQETQESQAILLSFEDITERRSIEEDLARESENVRLFESLAVVANGVTSLDETLQIFLEQICTHARCSIGHVYFAANGVSGEFISSKVWYLEDPKKFVPFKEGTLLLDLPPGAGLPGKVFTSRTSVQTCDLSHDLVSQKSRLAGEVGIRSAMGFPVFVGDSIVAVLEFFCTEIRAPEQRLIEVITHVILQLVRVFERKQADDERAQILLREREARAEAERANRAKDLFLATLSHELRTPLTAILSWGQMLQSGRLDAEKIKLAGKIIEDCGKSQATLIDDLLDVSRIIMGKLPLEMSEVDPEVIISKAINSVRSIADKKAIQIESSYDPHAGTVMADPLRLQQVFSNLLTNAVKFSAPQSKVSVTLTKSAGSVGERAKILIAVSDSGKGIASAFIPHIFESFSQEDGSSVRVHGGLGLGLAIVKSLVELHGGSVQAESRGEKQGATFTVTLPMKSAYRTSETQSRAVVDQVRLDGLRVLVVEDEPSSREAFRETLTSFGAKVRTAGSVQEALETFLKSPPDVLVSDIAMPHEDGYSLIQKIRILGPQRGGDVPAVAVTAHAGAEDIQRALFNGFQAHLAKPVDSDDLVKVIATLVGKTKK